MQLLQKELEAQDSSEGLETAILQFIKNGNALAHSYLLMSKQLEATQDFATTCWAQKSLPGTVAKKGGVITINDVQSQIEVVKQSDVQKAKVALAKARRVILAKMKKHFKEDVKA